MDAACASGFFEYEHVIGRGHVSGLCVQLFSWPRAGMVMREPGPNQLSKLLRLLVTNGFPGSDQSDQSPIAR